MTGFDRDWIGEGFDRGDAGVTKFREEWIGGTGERCFPVCPSDHICNPPRETQYPQTSMAWLGSGRTLESWKKKRQRRENEGDARRWNTRTWILLGWMVADAKPMRKTQRPRSYTCITGQLERLEQQGKIDNLFRPLSETHAVDIGMVLSKGTASYVVKRSEKVFAASTIGTYATFQDVQRKLGKNFGLLRIKEEEQPLAPTVNEKYVDLLDKGGTNRTLRVQRSISHVRQWSSYLRCLEIMDELEEFLHMRYDIVLRMREDVDIPFPIDMMSILHSLDDRVLLVQTCDSWGGINDKIAILGRDSATAYFTAPLQYFYLHPHEMFHTNQSVKVKNPETFLEKAYKMEGLAVHFLEAGKLLAIPIRRLSPQKSCYPLGVYSMKCLRKQLGLSRLECLWKAKCS